MKFLFWYEISFCYYVNWKRTLFRIENRKSCSLGRVAHAHQLWRENHASLGLIDREKKSHLRANIRFYIKRCLYSYFIKILKYSSKFNISRLEFISSLWSETHTAMKVIPVSYIQFLSHFASSDSLYEH